MGPQEIFGYLLLSGPLCGMIMILGGILLLYRGAITLGNAGEGALSIEFQNYFRFTTQYPAMGFFIIGLIFVLVPIFFGIPPKSTPIIVKAEAVNVEDPVSVRLMAQSWNSNLKHTGGKILEQFNPNRNTLQVVLTAPGHIDHTETIQLSALKNDTADLGKISMKKEIAKEKLKRNIQNAPEGVTLQGLETKATYGAAQ